MPFKKHRKKCHSEKFLTKIDKKNEKKCLKKIQILLHKFLEFYIFAYKMKNSKNYFNLSTTKFSGLKVSLNKLCKPTCSPY